MYWANLEPDKKSDRASIKDSNSRLNRVAKTMREKFIARRNGKESEHRRRESRVDRRIGFPAGTLGATMINSIYSVRFESAPAGNPDWRRLTADVPTHGRH